MNYLTKITPFLLIMAILPDYHLSSTPATPGSPNGLSILVALWVESHVPCVMGQKNK